ncbi:MAG TPA: hypothetical protein VIG49_11610 [Acetobacteraceae bacterium]
MKQERAGRHVYFALVLAGLAALQSTLHSHRLTYTELRQFMEVGFTADASLEAETMGYHPVTDSPNR